MSVKSCTICKIEKAFSEFYTQKNGKYGLRGRCKICSNLDNKKTSKIRTKKSYLKHREKRLIQCKVYYRKNVARYIQHAFQRKQKEKTNTPLWANKQQINEIYFERDRLNMEAGFVKYHVDHLIPLNGKFVSGLHVENNLQIILATENMSKKNKFEVTI